MTLAREGNHSGDSRWTSLLAAVLSIVGWSTTIAVAGAGCAYEVAPDESALVDETPSAAVEPITQGSLTTVLPWVVEIVTGGGQCTGSVLSENWILTAAHCVDYASTGMVAVTTAQTAGGRTNLYNGPGRFIRHPDYDGDTAHDIALVYLSGAGVDTAVTGRAKIYTGTERPWSQYGLDEEFVIVGWGLGSTGSSGTTDCDAATSGVKRIGYGFDMKKTADGGQSISAGVGDTHTCPGDSGAPWLLRRGNATSGYEYMIFAVHHGKQSFLFWEEQLAALIEANLSWVDSNIRAEIDRFGSYCSTHSIGGYPYRECFETSRGWSDLRGLAGKCMEAAGTTSGSVVRLNTCNVTNSRQQWSLIPKGEIRNAGASNLCLHATSTVNRTQLQVRTCNNTLNQRFGYEDGAEIPSALNYNDCVEVQGGFTTNGTPIQIYDCNNTASQWWTW